jgi:hypothetical protein
MASALMRLGDRIAGMRHKNQPGDTGKNVSETGFSVTLTVD